MDSKESSPEPEVRASEKMPWPSFHQILSLMTTLPGNCSSNMVIWESFFRRIEDLDDGDREALVDAIGDIFGHLHCLPVVVTPSLKSKGKVWTATQEGIHLSTNPIFYKLKGISNVPRILTGPAVGRLPRVKASNMVINRQLIEMHGGNVNLNGERRRTRRMAKARMARLSKRTKNRRQPPKRRKKGSLSPEKTDSQSSEDEEDGPQEYELDSDELEEDE